MRIKKYHVDATALLKHHQRYSYSKRLENGYGSEFGQCGSSSVELVKSIKVIFQDKFSLIKYMSHEVGYSAIR